MVSSKKHLDSRALDALTLSEPEARRTYEETLRALRAKPGRHQVRGEQAQKVPPAPVDKKV